MRCLLSEREFLIHVFVAIPLLLKHIEFILERYEHFKELDTRPDDFEDMFTPDWTLNELERTVAKGTGHLTEVSDNSQCFETVKSNLTCRNLESQAVGLAQGLYARVPGGGTRGEEVCDPVSYPPRLLSIGYRSELAARVDALLIERLKQPHSSMLHHRFSTLQI